MSYYIEEQIQQHNDALLNQVNRLIIGERTGYIEQYGEGEQTRYRTSTKKLVDSTVKSHLAGKKTVGCFYIGNSSKFLCFDIDENDPAIPKQMLQLLKETGFMPQDLHVEFSGLKGWHIWLFFEEPVPISKLVSFGKYIIGQLGTKGKKIELRPEQKEKSRAIKLPFAIHRKTMIRTTFIQHDLQPMEDTVQYFLNIQPIHKEHFSILNQIVENAPVPEDTVTLGRSTKQTSKASKPISSPVAEADELKSTTLSVVAQNLLHNGIPVRDAADTKGRHHYQFLIALYYKEQGFSESETIQKVTAWALNEKKMNRSQSSQQEIKQDVKTDVHHIYVKDKKFFATRAKEVVFYEEDIQAMEEILDPVLQQTAWAILILGRMYHEDGQIHFSIRQLEKMTGISRNTVHRRVKALIKSGMLELIEKGSYKKEKSLASLYKIPALLNQNMEESFTVFVQSSTWNEIYQEVLVQLYKYYMMLNMKQEKAQ
ncbi:TOTE conflict system archaeo-eukaryotic primase domain-containing protein [Paenibacillus amylolyticus]|uniref:TOTE conflict system archaeo-eukaryotic primase domain-containing protein n=1 Tax=Paenibacillus amylolyticus TaxID=1451 RepID=UPI003EB8B357